MQKAFGKPRTVQQVEFAKPQNLTQGGFLVKPHAFSIADFPQNRKLPVFIKIYYILNTAFLQYYCARKMIVSQNSPLFHNYAFTPNARNCFVENLAFATKTTLIVANKT